MSSRNSPHSAWSTKELQDFILNYLNSNIIAALSASGTVTLSGATINLTGLPTADPHVAGQLWMNSHVLTVSAG